MGDWWLDETPPRDKETDSEWWDGSVSWGINWHHPNRLGGKPLVIGPALRKLLEEYQKKQASKSKPYAAGGVVGSAGTHTFGGVAHIHLILDEACFVTAEVQKVAKFIAPEPLPNRDKGRINNTGPRRGSAFGRRGKKRY